MVNDEKNVVNDEKRVVDGGKKVVNEVVYNYLKENYGKYDAVALKKMILSKGYSDVDYSDALVALKMDATPKVASSPVRAKNVMSQYVISERGGVRWGMSIFLGFIASIILTLFVLYGQIIKFLPMPNMANPDTFYMILTVFIVLFTVFAICKLLAFYAFKKIGLFSEKRILKVFSLILMVVFILMVVVAYVFLVYLYSFGTGSVSGITGEAVIDLNGGSDLPGDSLFMSGFEEFDFSDFMGLIFMQIWLAIPLFVKICLGLLLFLWFIYLICYVFFSVGLIRVGKEVRLSLTAGILRLMLTLIILGGTVFSIYVFVRIIIDSMFIIQLVAGIAQWYDVYNIFNWFIGILLVIVYIFETIVLFLASRKYEKR